MLQLLSVHIKKFLKLEATKHVTLNNKYIIYMV